MSLDKEALEDDLNANFGAPGATIAACAGQWASAVATYAAGVVPACNPAAIPAAQTALATALTSAFAAANLAAVATAMESAFLTFGGAIGPGMAPGFTATPPAGAVGWATLLASPKSRATAAQDIATAIDTWMKTGTATMSAPPGTTVDWS